MVFFLLIFSVFLYYSLHKYSYEYSAKRFIVFISIILIALSGLRHEGVGNDTYAYMIIYDNSGNVTWNYVFEDFIKRFISPTGNDDKDPGMLCFMKILHTLNLNSRFFLFIVSSMLIIPLGIFIYKNSDNFKSVLFSYFFYISLFYGYLPNSAIRQTIALSFVLWAYLLILNKKRKGIFFIIIGALFHKSALVSLILMPLLYLKNIKLWYKVSFIPFLIILIFQEQVAYFLVDGNEVYSGYGTGLYYSDNNQSKPFFVIVLMSLLYFFVWIYLMEIKGDFIDKKLQLMVYGCALTFVLTPLVLVNPTALRIISYFAPCMAIIVGYAFQKIRWGKIYFTLLLLAFMYKSFSNINAYRFMWQKMELHERYSDLNLKEIDYLQNNNKELILT